MTALRKYFGFRKLKNKNKAKKHTIENKLIILVIYSRKNTQNHVNQKAYLEPVEKFLEISITLSARSPTSSL
jgi:hypothetical protein